ncbi:nucleotidyltransferase domain-containing protein [Polaribacter sp. M15]
MTYKETLFFIGQSLTINHEQKNKIVIEEQLKTNAIDWDAVVKISTAHFVFPALYCNLKRANFLHYLPEDLVGYMKHITDLNRERNEQIIAQAKEINRVLLANDITPIFLKGTGNLLEGLYEDIAERMVGDIDFIVSKEEYPKAIAILKKMKYKEFKEGHHIRKFHWHYPRLVHPNHISAVEVHNKILKKPFDTIFGQKQIQQDVIEKFGIHFLSSGHKILNAILPKIINDQLYYSQHITLRTMYDVFLVTTRGAYSIQLENKAVFKKFNNFLSCIQLVLNYPNAIKIKESKTTKKYQKSYVLRLNNSKIVKLQSTIIDKWIQLKSKFIILKMALYDKEYRSFVLKRIFQIDFYKSFAGFTSSTKN